MIVVILRMPKMRTVTNFLLANLAFADVCVGIFCVNPAIVQLLSAQTWILGNVSSNENKFDYNFIEADMRHRPTICDNKEEEEED